MSSPQAEPSPQALGESLAALAALVAALRGQVTLLSQRLDRAGIVGDLDLAARFEELAQIAADALDAAATRGPAAPPLAGSAWTARPTRRSWTSCGSGPMPYSGSTTAAMS
jgi:hypothetical protein